MTDRVIQIEVASPLEVFGPADVFLTQMQNMYPKLKIFPFGSKKYINNTDSRYSMIYLCS